MNAIIICSKSGKYQYTIHDVPLDAVLRYQMGQIRYRD